MRKEADPRTGARQIADTAYVFTSGAFAMNSGVVLDGTPLRSKDDPASSRSNDGRAGDARARDQHDIGGRADRTAPDSRQSAAASGGNPLRLAGAERCTGSNGPGSGAEQDRRQALLIDPAYFPSDIERIAAFLEDESAEASRIILTHSDWDHIVGASRWPHAAVVASSEYPGRAAEEGARIARSLQDFDGKMYVTRPEPFAIPDPSTLVGSPADLVWSGPAAHLIPAGGHTRDGLMVHLRDEKILFAGDHLSDREIPFIGDSVASYVQTLRHARTLAIRGEIETLVPGHGDICGRDEALDRIDEDTDYIVRLDAWVRETLRTVDTLQGILERCEEVVFRKGWEIPDVQVEHRSNVALLARQLGVEP